MVGLVTGYYCNKVDHMKIKLKFYITAPAWIGSIVIKCILIFASYSWNRGDEPSQEISAFYGGISRFLWSLSLSWDVLACTYHRGGLLI